MEEKFMQKNKNYLKKNIVKKNKSNQARKQNITSGILYFLFQDSTAQNIDPMPHMFFIDRRPV